MREVVITGLGMISPIGDSVSLSWQNLLDMQTGVDIIKSFDAKYLDVKIAAEVKSYNPGSIFDSKDINKLQKYIGFAALATDEAVKDSGIDTKKNSIKSGCSIGVGLGGLNLIYESSKSLYNGKKTTPFLIPYSIANMASGVVSKLFNLQGPNLCSSTACASGSHAICFAYDMIQKDFADIMIAGGSESAIGPLAIAGFSSMGALSKNNTKFASRPFDLQRDGFVMGEGAGILILEEKEHAIKRNAKIYAHMIGYGVSSDAYHITRPLATGALRAMELALKYSKTDKKDIDYINAHGTSTKLNDIAESKAIKSLFKKDILISSTKGATGHCLGAAGAIEGVFSVMAINNNIAPATTGYKLKDLDCDLDLFGDSPREKKIKFAMSNSFGFGGTNSSLIFKEK